MIGRIKEATTTANGNAVVKQRKSIMAAKVLFGDDGEHLFEKYRKKYGA